MPHGYNVQDSNGHYTDIGDLLVTYHYHMAIACSDSEKAVLFYKRLPCEMEITPYSPLILEATKNAMVFTVQMNPNNPNNPFKRVTIFDHKSPCDLAHPEMSTWEEVSGLAFFMTQVDNFKITWTSEEIVVIDVSCKDSKFRTAKPTDEEREEIFTSQHNTNHIRTTNIRKNYMARPSALTLMVLTEFGSIYRLCRKTEKGLQDS